MEIATIILAAGQGTRLNSALPKPLHHIGGRPMLAWSLDAAKAAAASRVVTVLPKESDSIIEWLDGQETCIQDSPKGTGHAVKAAKEQLADFHGVVLIMFADTPLVTAKTLAALATTCTTCAAGAAWAATALLWALGCLPHHVPHHQTQTTLTNDFATKASVVTVHPCALSRLIPLAKPVAGPGCNVHAVGVAPHWVPAV